MKDEDKHDIEPEDLGEGNVLSTVKGRRAFKNLRRELTNEELASPAIQRMLIDDIERLEKDNFDLSEYQDKFHDADKKSAVLEEKMKVRIAQEVVFGVCLTVGAAAIGFAPAIWDISKIAGIYAIALGVILIFGGIVSKVVKR